VNLSFLVALGILLGATLLFIILSMTLKGRKLIIFRSIPAFRILNHMIGRSVEEGNALHISLGSGNLTGRQCTIGFSGLSTLDNLSRVSLIGDKPAVCTSGDGGLILLSKDVLTQAYKQAQKLSIYQGAHARLTGATSGSYVTGTLITLLDEPFSGSVFIGDFNILAVLLTGLPFHDHASLTATDSLCAQAAFYASSDESLLGEDAYAAGAYTSPNPSRSASLVTQDVLRWVTIALVILYIILQVSGVV
jgi:Domain of unknown function (DUF6754)